MAELSAGMKASAMDETEAAFRELVSVGRNIGLTKGELAMMMHKIADELAPTLLIPRSDTVQ